MRHLESAHQRAYIARCRMHPIARRVFAVPNGGKRSKVTAAILKGEGALAGVPDVCLPYPAHGCAGLWVEFKHGNNRPTAAQLEYIDFLVSTGHVVLVAYDWAQAWRWTERYLDGTLSPALLVVA